ncbi:hypothetical protein M5X00_30010 [Paenibacillus alvei]|uniref:Uncharacterized protein n=1 Tax=Paenibacillus alvei TaxID=44250 RepID=A0ABT4H153_PAEAL|nr:hypothetical protein [Paenibacillus alvei]MCY9543719.1 hypothetical protein [Paenibacillus alvei]MCY9708218.1 hypothetical protein [Paenibacillus alvei]MCY9737926.1 hypothetical protein [Paenibacillus alvei]MCY9758458.1 hypothetical protein [Paenibacillus alvei]MCY9762644.1 hypothetical protein [Paenibacillus alvei]
MSMWSDTPRISAPPNTKDVDVILGYVKDLANTVAKMAKDLEFIVNGNVDAKNIRSESIETRNLKANSITTDKIQAGSVIAEKINVGELSAISANLGHIVAGLIESIQIYGSLIATRRDGYPRCEMSNTENMFAAYGGNGRAIKMQAYGSLGVPLLTFTFNQDMTILSHREGGFYISAGSADVNITGENIFLMPRGQVRVQNWDSIYSEDDQQTLKKALGR